MQQIENNLFLSRENKGKDIKSTNKNIGKFDDSIGEEFYIESVNKLEEMYNKLKAFGEITLVAIRLKY